MSKRRLDHILQELFPDWSRSKLQTLIEKGLVEVFLTSWKIEDRPGAKFDPLHLSQDRIRIAPDDEFEYVSRGGLKLKRAIEEFNISVKGRLALDVGLSTGGFTDYLLKNDVARILGIDVGTDQLHRQLRKNAKLMFFDKVNAKAPLPASMLSSFFDGTGTDKFDLVVVDVSFISLSKIIPNVSDKIKHGGDIVTLLKPQFELAKSDLNKKGVVKTQSGLEQAQKKIIEVLQHNKLEVMGTIRSPIEGENGNKEFLIWSKPCNP